MELNCEWTKDYDTEKDFNIFYKEIVKKINVYFLYINKNKELSHIKREKLKVNNGILSKEKVDLLYVYTQNDLPQLKKRNDINKIIFGEKEKDEMDDIIQFDENMIIPDDNELLKDMIDDI